MSPQLIGAKRLSRAELEEAKLDKFRSMVAFLAANSPFYADVIADRSIDPQSCHPTDFPAIDKTIVMQNFDRIVTAPGVSKRVVEAFLTRSKNPSELLLDKYLVIHTSGSSGEVGYFLHSKEDWARATASRSLGNAPRMGMGKWRVAYYAIIDGHYGFVSTVSNPWWRSTERNMDIQLFDVNDPLSKVIEELNQLQPHLVFGYTTALRILAEKQTEGNLHIKPVMIKTGGESMTDGDREALIKAFGCEVGGVYGSSEHLLMGVTKFKGTDLVLYDDDLIYEFFDDHTLVTNLFNRTLPLVRYRMNDVIRPAYEDKGAEPYLTVRGLVGRSELVPTFVNKHGEIDTIAPITVVELFVAGVTRFQLHLLGKTRFLLKVRLHPRLSREQGDEAIDAMRRRLAEILRQKSMDNVQYDVQAVDDLPVDPVSGKFRLIVDGSRSQERRDVA